MRLQTAISIRTLELEVSPESLLPGTSAELPGALSELETLFGTAAEELPATLEAGASPELDTPGTLLDSGTLLELEISEETTSEEDNGESSAFASEGLSPHAARKATERAKKASTGVLI